MEKYLPLSAPPPPTYSPSGGGVMGRLRRLTFHGWRRRAPLLLGAAASIILVAVALALFSPGTSATAAAEGSPPLTASLENVATSHDGENVFTFEVRFSEELSLSYKTLRDHAFTVTGGAVKKAGRLEQGSNIGWRITVRPDGNGDVTVVLPETTDCGAQEAICTEDGRKLSHRLELTVSGPDSQQAEANTPATGAPTIGGTAQVGETLTVDTSGISDADGLTNVSYSYRWLADGAGITGAASDTYAPVIDDMGKAISVAVSFTDDGGNEESLTSAATDAVEPGTGEAQAANTPATGAPAISGTAQVGETLTADTSGIADEDGLDSVSYGHQWLADDADISGATDSSYTLASADEGKAITVTVSFTDDAGNDETLTSAATDAVAPKPNAPATGTPAIGGTAQVGETLTADTSGISDADGLTSVSYSYRWLADDADISGATDSTYTLAGADEGKAISVRVSFTDDAGHDETLTSAATAAVEAAAEEDEEPTDRPHGLSAAASQDGIVLAWKKPVTEGYVSDYRILRHRPELGEAEPLVYVDYTETRDTSYTDTEVEPGVLYVYRVKAVVNFLGDVGEASWPVEIRAGAPDAQPQTANSPATGAPAISGTAQVDGRLTVDTSAIADADGLADAAFAYQWLADGSDISGATDSTYTLAGADEGASISVRVTFTDDGGNDETLTSVATDAVAPRPNSPATGTPAITGTVRVGETLTADTSEIADADGLDNAAFSFQWVSSDGNAGTDIQDATDAAYTLASGDAGNTISVRVSFTDDAGHAETLTSAATVAVAADPHAPQEAQANTPAAGVPAISGMAQVGGTLTVYTFGISDEDGLENAVFSYQWLRGDGTTEADISGASGASYTLADDDGGKIVGARVSFTDDAGNAETLTSVRMAIPVPPTAEDLAPSGLTGTADSEGVNLAWDAPAAWAGQVTGYHILRRRAGAPYKEGLLTLVANTSSRDTEHTDYGANELDVRYIYRVKAVRGEERSQWSDRLDIRGAGPADPDPDHAAKASRAPRGLSAHHFGSSGIRIYWQAPNSGRDDITGWVVQRRWASSAYLDRWIDAGLDEDRQSGGWSDAMGRGEGRIFQYRVIALRSEERSIPSAPVEITGEGDPHPHLVDEPQAALALGASVQNVPPQEPQTSQQQGSGIDYGPVLISNTGQALRQDNVQFVISGDAAAQKFTTGPNLTGYLLDRVAVAVNRERLEATDRTGLQMTVREDCSGDPCGAVFATLNNPVGFIIHGNLQDSVSRGLLVFGSVGSHRDIKLERNTDYWLRIDLDYPGTLRVKTTDSTSDDSGGASGWSMGVIKWWNGTSWQAGNFGRTQMSLHGRTPNLDLTTWDYHPVAGHGLWGTTGGSHDRLWVSSGANRRDVFSYSLEDNAYGDPVIDTDWKLFNRVTPGGGTVKALSNMAVATASGNYGLVYGGLPGAQPFTTGHDREKYRLRSVVIRTAQATIPSGLTATIRKSDSSGHPGDVVRTLANPGSFSNNGRAVFTPTGEEALLDPNKTYFFHLESGNCSDSQYVTPATCEDNSGTWSSSGTLNLKRTQDNLDEAVDGDGEPGWGLGAPYYYDDSSSAWEEDTGNTDSDDSYAIKIEVNIINREYFGTVHNSNYGQQCVHDKARIVDSKKTTSGVWTGHGPAPGTRPGDSFNDIVHGHLVGKGIVFCDVASRPVGLWSDETTMWVGDQATGMVRGFNLDTKERDSGKDFDARKGGIVTPRITGITGNGSKMWVAHAVSGKLLAYVKPSGGATDGDRSSSDDITLTAANAVPSSLYTDGTTMWVLDDGDQKLYAYTLSNGNRNSGKDLDLTRHGRLFASGIWSDGSKMYVGGNHWVSEQQNLWPRYVHYGPFSAKACQRIADRLESIGSSSTLDTDSDYSNGCVEIYSKDSDGEPLGKSFYGVTGETTNNHGEGTGGCQKTDMFDNRVYSSDGSAWVDEAYPRVGCTGYARVLAYPKP